MFIFYSLVCLLYCDFFRLFSFALLVKRERGQPESARGVNLRKLARRVSTGISRGLRPNMVWCAIEVRKTLGGGIQFGGLHTFLV